MASKMESEQKTQSAIDEVWRELESEKEQMRAYYDIERFDIDYLSDAVAFFGPEGDTTNRSHSVSISQPHERTRGSEMKLARK